MSREMIERVKAGMHGRMAIELFLDYVRTEYQLELRDDCANRPHLDRVLLDEFFEIDQAQLDKERREVLDNHRKLTEPKGVARS